MVDPSSGGALRLLFGKAFLVQLHRGDLDTARLFARAFLVREIDAAREPLRVAPLA